jgi:serine protease Do
VALTSIRKTTGSTAAAIEPKGLAHWHVHGGRVAAALRLASLLAAVLTTVWVNAAANGSATVIPPATMPNFRAVIAQSAAAVVGISVTGLHKVAPGESPFDLDDPFYQFFRGLPDFQLHVPSHSSAGSIAFHVQGSGFIIASDGLILTSAHVVHEAKDVTIKLNDLREFRAKVLGVDLATDIAVLRINAHSLPVVRLGDVQQLRVGDPVLAIGSPYGFEQSASQGIISAKDRSLPGATSVPYIQTDAAVNPGNSGGPLFDASGAVVGINSQIYSQSGGFQGLSFAVPINLALRVKDQIVATGHASHAQLGIAVQDVSQRLAKSFGLDRPGGALITFVGAPSAAASAGLLPGDIVTEFNSTSITRSAELIIRTGMAQPGETARITYWRDAALHSASVKLGTAMLALPESTREENEVESADLGLILRILTDEQRERLHIQNGLLIAGVSGASARAGLSPGDILLAVNSTPAKSIDQTSQLLSRGIEGVALLILRDGRSSFVCVERP